MFEITTLAVNPEFANEGKWVEYPGTPAKFKIARFNNRKAELARHEANLELYKRLQAQLKSNTPEEFTDTEALQVQAKDMHMRNQRMKGSMEIETADGKFEFFFPNMMVQSPTSNAGGENQDYTTSLTLTAEEGVHEGTKCCIFIKYTPTVP